MCEPMHSIVQFPDQDDDGNPTGGKIDAIPQSGLWSWGKKKIASWFHFSKMGFGHSEAMATLTPTARWVLPPDTKYEVAWWKRQVKIDGGYSGAYHDASDALEAATEYANRTSIGNLTLLRQFVETSMRKSERPNAYYDNFHSMLTIDGRNQLGSKVRNIVGSSYLTENIVKSNLDKLVKIMMGFTRKRGLLIPEWADDAKLWKAPTHSIILPTS